MDSLNIGKSVSFNVIITKEKLQLLPRKYVTIESVKSCVANLKKNTYVVYASENKLSSYHGLIESVFDYGEEILCKVSKLHSGI